MCLCPLLCHHHQEKENEEQEPPKRQHYLGLQTRFDPETAHPRHVKGGRCPHLRRAFKAHCGSVGRMDRGKFAKIVAGAPGLMNARFASRHVDLAFAKAKSQDKRERTLNFHQFVAACICCANQRFKGVEK